MKERPILFSAPMVKAILAGTKTQTRRVLRQANRRDGAQLVPDLLRADAGHACPYGAAGDRLWVRETLRQGDNGNWHYAADGAPVEVLRSDDDAVLAMVAWAHHKEGSTCVSIHMPRWASRITLDVVSVRAERLQDITEEEARAEGALFHDGHGVGHTGWRHDRDHGYVYPTARASFAALWEAINGERASCASNPWIWRVEFRRAA